MSFLRNLEKAKLKLSFTDSETKDIHLLLRNNNTDNAYELYSGRFIDSSFKSITIRNMSTTHKLVYSIESDGYWNDDPSLITMSIDGGNGMTTIKPGDFSTWEVVLQINRLRIMSEATMVVEVALYA